MRRLVERIRPLYRRPDFRRLLVLNVIYGLSGSFVVPFMSMFGTLEAHMTLLRFGTFMTVNALSGIAITTTLAHYSDVHFSRRAKLLLGGVAGAAGYLGYAYLRSFLPLLLVGQPPPRHRRRSPSRSSSPTRESSRGPEEISPRIRERSTSTSSGCSSRSRGRSGPAIATPGSWSDSRSAACFSARRLDLVRLHGHRPGSACLHCRLAWERPRTANRRARCRRSSALLGRSDIAAHFAAFVLVTASGTIGMMNLPMLILNTLRGERRPTWALPTAWPPCSSCRSCSTSDGS